MTTFKMSKGPTFATHEDAVWHRLHYFSLVVPIPDAEAYYEQLVCERAGENRYRLLCIPFFLYGVALGDILEGDASAELEDLEFQVAERSGRSVYRVWFDSGSVAVIEDCLTNLTSLGALTEQSSKRLYAIDAENPKIAERVEAYLRKGESSGKWEYERGYLASGQ